MTQRLRIALAMAGLAAMLSGSRAMAEVFEGNTTDGPLWNRPFVSGNGLTGDLVPYSALAFNVSAAGSYSFVATPQTGAFDIVEFLYDATFAPATPLLGYLEGADELINGQAEQMQFALASSTTYYAVVTGYSSFDYDPYALSITGPGSVTMVEPGFQAADFNEDRSVDGGDLFSWREGFDDVGPKAHSQGDADGDHDTDGNDFLIWQRQLNVSFDASPAATSVPEPGTAGLMMAAAATALAMRRRRP